MRTVALLGAGASIDAGVPGAMQMSAKLVDSINAKRGHSPGVAHALNYAAGALIAYDSAGGANPNAGIDVERLFTAVQMLGNRNAVEVAPFVSWSPVLESIGRRGRMPAGFDAELRASIVGSKMQQATKRPSSIIEKAINGLLGDGSEATYETLEREMLLALVKLVGVNGDQLEYLAPLLRMGDHPVQIATLNYDRSIEMLAAQVGLLCDTGIAKWRGGHDWEWDAAADIRLLKLHGSIDWLLAERRGLGGMSEAVVEQVDAAQERSQPWQDSPGLVFGSRGKLRADGPFLAMLRQFDEMLADADRVVVVGYSFRDDHINVALTRWINSAESRKLVVIDPNLEPLDSFVRNPFVRRLQIATSRGADETRLDLEVVREKACLGIPMVLGEGHA